MKIDLPEPECSKCGQKNSETFQRRNKSGRRCLQCGYENVVSAPADRVGDRIWQLDTRIRKF